MTPTKQKFTRRISRSSLASPFNFHAISRISSPDNLGFETYRRMVETDETIASAIEFIEMTVFGHLGEYEHPEPEIEAFVRRNLLSMERSLSRVVSGIVSCLWVGHANLEIVFEERDGKIWLRDLCDIYPGQLEYEIETKGPRAGYLRGLRQYPGGPLIPIDKVLHVTHHGRWDNPYGLSRLKCVYQSWFNKQAVRIMWPQTLERYGGPLAIGRTPVPEQPQENGRTRAENMLDALEHLQTSSAFILGPQEEVEFVEIKRAFGGDFEAAENHYSRMQQRGLLMPSLLFDNGSVGSFAMSETHFDVFRRSTELLVEDIDRALVGQVIRPLLWLNYGEQEDYGHFETRAQTPEELERYSKIVFSMVNARVFRPDVQEDFDWLRSTFGAPSGVEPAAPDQQTAPGKDGLPGVAPDGQDGATPKIPRGGGRTPQTKQGRPPADGDDDEEED